MIKLIYQGLKERNVPESLRDEYKPDKQGENDEIKETLR